MTALPDSDEYRAINADANRQAADDWAAEWEQLTEEEQAAYDGEMAAERARIDAEAADEREAERERYAYEMSAEGQVAQRRHDEALRRWQDEHGGGF